MDRALLYGEGMYYRGKPLENYTKDELIDIIEKLVLDQHRTREEHSRQLGVLTGR